MTTLEKIRAEIESQRKEASKKHSEDERLSNYYFGLNDGLKDARDIIDKYAEQEPTSPCDLCIFYSMDGDNKYCGYIGECPARAKGW